MIKKETRKQFRQMRQELTALQLNKIDDLLLIRFQQLPVEIPGLIMTYAPIEKWNEFDPQHITDYCCFKNPSLQLLYPLIAENRDEAEMIAVMVDDNTVFERNCMGLDEPVNGIIVSPEEIGMVIVPLVAFDKEGFRIGYGKGYYDRFLAQCCRDCIKVAFSYFDPVENIDDINEWDVALDFCITPEKIYSF